MSDRKDVAIIMGSDSDWPVMEEAANALDSFGISYSADVVSAHRMPEEMVEFAKSAASKGYKVIIAGAGGAAHLPGMVASLTTLPVIGVPVATVGIDNAKNAGILAARIIGSADPAVAKKIEAQLSELSTEAKAKGAQLSARRNTKTGF